MLERDTGGALLGPEVAKEPTSKRTPKRSSVLGSSVILAFGVVTPLAAWVIELFTGFSAGVFLNPIPTLGHVFLIALVPIANAVGLLRSGPSSPGYWRARWFLNAAAIGISFAYAVAFLPILPWAVIGLMFAVGFLPLSPLTGLISALAVRSRLKAESPEAAGRLGFYGWLAAIVPVLFLTAYLVPEILTRDLMRRALRPESASAEAAIRTLRKWGDRNTLLFACYTQRRPLWDSILGPELAIEGARRLYFRVTGQPFNAQPAPAQLLHWMRRAGLEDVSEAGVEWDGALGTDSVAGRVSGLSMLSSRLDVSANADAGWSYSEWTMEFRNNHPRDQREARAQIQLPPGGVVSRLTLWVHGEEREAAFAGRGQVRAAYEKVAVQQRRDPVLVTTSGPDQVLMQCFPVPPGGGTMKVRIGITSPLELAGDDRAVLHTPVLLEQNFGTPRSLTHGVWIEGVGSIAGEAGGFAAVAADEGRFSLQGQWRRGDGDDARKRVVLKRSTGVRETWARDRHDPAGGFVRQTERRTESKPARRLAVVVDGSEGMGPALRDVAEALASGSAGPELAVFVAAEGVVRLPGSGWDPETLRALREWKVEGGQDSIPALEAAWDWVASADGVVLWVHGPQPMALSSPELLRQRMERRRGDSAPHLVDVSVTGGPNRVLEKLDGLERVVVSRPGDSLRSSVVRWLEIASGKATQWEWVREYQPEGPEGIEVAAGSTHVARLWALEEARRLAQQGRAEQAKTLAATHQLVTPLTGAVVLETAAQYREAGLTPVDPLTVPVVPEPGVGWLLLMGLGVLAITRRRSAVASSTGPFTARNLPCTSDSRSDRWAGPSLPLPDRVPNRSR